MNIFTAKLVDAAKELLKAAGYFVENLWHVEDIHFICEQTNQPSISDDEAMAVFTVANEQFEGETGISWPQLEKALNVYQQRKTLLSSMCETNSI